jgi:hypothetical protein
MADVESAELALQIDEAGRRMLGLLPSVLRRCGAAVNLRGIETRVLSQYEIADCADSVLSVMKAHPNLAIIDLQ